MRAKGLQQGQGTGNISMLKQLHMMALAGMFLAYPAAFAVEDNTGYLNVKDFGAKGDNVADDTAAIQAAFNAQATYPFKELVFPAGSYHVRDTIRMESPNVRGEGPVGITQETENKDVFLVNTAWRGNIHGLTIYGGAKQINMGNANVDQGLVLVENCSFDKSADFAVYMRPGSNSTHLVIRGCHFGQCEQVLYTSCDMTTFSDGWITTAWMNNKAAIVAHGAKLVMDNVCGVPLVTGKDDRWIDNYGTLTCRNFRFGGEFGGMTPVWNFSRAGIVLEDCSIAAQGSGKSAAVWCEEIPNLFTIRNSTLMCPLLKLSPKIDLAKYFDHIPANAIHFDLANNVGEFVQDGTVAALVKGARNRDTRPLLAGQMSLPTTAEAIARIAQKVKALPPSQAVAAVSHGHTQKTDSQDYLEATKNANWDLDDNMDASSIRNSEFIAAVHVGDDTVFMRRTPDPPGGAWPHALLRNVAVDLDKTPFISWKQKDPGSDPLPEGVGKRSEAERLDKGITMPMGFALRVRDEETQRLVWLFEAHTPPWFNYGARDLRELFGVKGGMRTLTIKYYPLGAYITGKPLSGSAIPGEYQILEFIRFEKE
jgi:hypothetical protein